ncbi:hypothetical protein GOP47_0007022 [Adiantum capillus-veneris]|uniref:Uncharacterized protein n=1 Tax=Adiantum capillus-veneris TaxID=13818 RepID=A0A9D4ZIT1_ADICA|nr:hypothetical protein GOP47_0007022 [Adiantum capillus-veneris]
MQRAPSTVCLLCASCRRLVTPCLVCAHLIPCCSCYDIFFWVECKKCNALNPLGDQERKLLGFPPALALASSMARRVLIAHIGRPLSTLSTHLYHQHIEQALVARQSEDAAKDQGLANGRGSCALEETILTRLPRLPFVQSDGIVKSFSPPLQKQIVDAKDDNHEQTLLAENQDLGMGCANCSRSCSCLMEFGEVITNEALRCCQEQLVALHCAEALSTDLNSLAYPLCNTVIKSSLSIQETKTCNSRFSRDCSLGLGKGLSIDMLRVVSSIFSKDYEIWLEENKATSLENCKLEDVLQSVEAFGGKQNLLIDLQRSVLRAVAAQKQIATDSKDDPSLLSTAHMLELFFSDRSKERMETFTRAAESFQGLLKQINLFLEFLYTCSHAAASKLHSFPLCTNHDRVLEFRDPFVEKRQLQTAVSYWLLVYHDVAHAVHVSREGTFVTTVIWRRKFLG